MGMIGITGGAHRLWAHRAYKAKWPLRVILVVFNTVAFQDAAFHWARDHRVHHKYSETDADPHNATRGFFFSHVGWLLCKKHPDVVAKGKGLDLTDLRADRVLMFQLKWVHFILILAKDQSQWFNTFQVLLYTYAARLLHSAHAHTLLLLERITAVLLVRCHHVPLVFPAKHDLVG